MEWYLALFFIFGSLVLLMMTGLPVALCFMLINIVGAFVLWGGESGLLHLITSMYGSVTTFTLLPAPLFILMGEVMFHSGIGTIMIDTVDKWIGRLPGRLGLLAVGAGTILSTLTGLSVASVAMLGSVLVPEMEKRGYKKTMSIGPILGSGGLAIMIPPSAVAVLLGAIGEISIGKILIAIIMPGVLLAVLYATYIIVRCKLQPSIAPGYEPSPTTILDRSIATVRYILPAGLVVFLVTGIIFLGIVTPSEAAATGALGCFILAALYGRFNWEIVKKSVQGTLRNTVMIFIVFTGVLAFSQLLAYTGATRGLVQLATGLPLAPIVIIIAMQVLVLFLGCFMDVIAIMMVTVPMFMPIVHSLGFNEIWFAVLILVNLEMAAITPPFGMSLFVMKGVAPADTTLSDIYHAAVPFICCDILAMAIIMVFPSIALWLPGLMR